MEDLEPICDTEQASFCVELMKRLEAQRAQNYLCDITLVAKEGKEFRAHRNVLSAASPFFAKLLQCDMKERDEGIIRLEEISESIMEDILEFIYTGRVVINEENANDLVIAADYLLIVCLKTISARFLEQQLTIANCISTFYFAEKYQCEELVTNSRKFVLDNFASVTDMDEFLNLEAEEVERWIAGDEICIGAEEDVFKVIQKWVEQNKGERKARFEELFRHVRLVLISRDYLLNVVTNELVRESGSCLIRVLDAIELISSASEDTFMQSPRRRLQTHVIVARAGKYTLCYLPEKDKWKRLADGLSVIQGMYTKVIKFRDQLYTFSGNSKAERFDPFFNSWAVIDMDLSYNLDRVAVVRGQIYALEINSIDNKTTVKRFDSELSTWQTILSREGCRVSSCVVSAGDCLYVLGGRLKEATQFLAIAERFNTVDSKWEKIADMQEIRGSAFGVSTQGKIFVAGGKVATQLLESCELYNVSTNEWQFIASLNAPRWWGSMVCSNGTLYVLGGSCRSSLTLPLSAQSAEFTVESYDPTTNRWIQRTSIPVGMIVDANLSFYKGCAMKLSKGVLDKIVEI